MNSLRSLITLGLTLLVAAPAWSQKKHEEFLTEEEQSKLREAQDPSERIEIYLALEQVRLDRFESFRQKPPDPQYNNGAYLDSLLGQYVALNDELKDWVQYQFERSGDMRRGLRSLLQRGANQLSQLRHVQETPGNFASDYSDSLRDAIEDVSDTLDGATKALAGQEKKFGELKREEKAEAQAAKERRKEDEKRAKEEKKLRKRQRKHTTPEED